MPFELANPSVRRGPFRLAVFDFDGTLSLLREGWARLMADMGVERIGAKADADRLELEMLELSGKPTIHQMRKLAEEIGPASPSAESLLDEFLRRLFATVDVRRQRLANGTDAPAAWTVPGSHAILDDLQSRGVQLVLASGTDARFVHAEAALLGLTHYFGEHIYAPDGDLAKFDKGDVIRMQLRERGLTGADLIGFGDGYAETVQVKRAGGVAVGVASREAGQRDVNEMKRGMLLGLGADVIVPHYEEHAAIISWLFGE